MPKKTTTYRGNSTMHPETERSRGRCGTCGGHGLTSHFGGNTKKVRCPACGEKG